MVRVSKLIKKINKKINKNKFNKNKFNKILGETYSTAKPSMSFQ